MKPLTPATAQLFKPLNIQSGDRLSLSLDKEGTKFNAHIWGERAYDEKRGFASLVARRSFPSRVPEKKTLDGYDKWQFAATDTTALIIHFIWPREQIIFEDDDARVMYDYLLATSMQHDQNVKAVAHFKDSGKLPGPEVLTVQWHTDGNGSIDPVLEYEGRPGVIMHPDFPLSPYQQVAAWCLRNSEGYSLFMEQGTGKTPVVIAEICNAALKIKKRMHRTLVVCPKNVRTNWVNEIAKFKTCKGKVTVLRGGEIDRIKQMIEALVSDDDDKFTVVIVSYETMSRMVHKLKAIDWDLICLDESHFIKWPGTKRAQASKILREAGKKRVVLTGTPIANSPLDVFAQLEFLGSGWSGFTTWKQFRSFYGKFDRLDGRDRLVGLQNMPFMKERLARLSFIIRKEEALPSLPPKVYDVLEVEMTSQQINVYEQLRDQFSVEIENDLATAGEKRGIVINNILTKLLRLAQVTSGFVPLDAILSDEGDVIQEREILRFDPNPKMELLVETLKEKELNEKTIIWATWVQDIKTISARLAVEGIKAVTFYGATKDDDRDIAVWSFNNDPEVTVFLGNPGAGGTGLNLLGYNPQDPGESNCTHIIYYSQDWSSTKRSQSEDRAHRRGTREHVRITDLCVPQSIDEQIRTRVMQKRITAWEISDVREILSAVLKGVLNE